MKGQKLHLPITKFSKIPPTEFSTYDDRYIPAEIVVMHSGINRNQSLFTTDSIAQASWSLSDIPILGFIKKVNDEDYDFDEHNVEVVLTDDDFKVNVLGRIIGNIPKDNNYHYTYYPDNEEMYVVVEGYLWADYMNEALEIFKRSSTKSVSMEIIVDDGYLNDDGIFCITDYRYLGICILGDDVRPAMAGAKITVDNAPLEHYSYKKDKEEVMGLDKLNKNVETQDVETIEVDDIEVEETPEEIVEEVEEEVSEEVVEETDEPEEEETPFEEVEVTKDGELSEEERAELEELRIFKLEIEKEKREKELAELYATSESKGLDISDIKANAEGKSVPEIKAEIAMKLLDNTFSAKEQTLPDGDGKAIVKDVSASEHTPYGAYTDRLRK